MSETVAAPKRKGGRPANPTPKWDKDRKVWVVRITLPKPSGWPAGKEAPRKDVDLDKRLGPDQFAAAKAVAKFVSDSARAGNVVDLSLGETCSAYRIRLEVHRKELGRRGGKMDASTWNKWIAPKLGPLPVASVTRDDVERVRDMLDEQITIYTRTEAKEGIGSKRARNIWTVVTTTFKAACAAKRRDLRVREDNPCTGVLPPEKGKSRQRTFLYPNEIATLLACPDVDLGVRAMYAVGCYLYLRPGELRALLVSDVDLDAGVVHVTKSYDEAAEQTKPTKTDNGVRDVPIPEALFPLLRRLVADRKPGDLLLPVMAERSDRNRGRTFRTHLTWAGLTRPRLTASNPREEPVDFRSLRDSGVTWLALSGVDLSRIQRRAGHEDVSTSLGYVKLAEDINGDVGEPFPPLPEALGGFGSKQGFRHQNTQETSRKPYRRRDSNPHALADGGF